jgi:hypothetical protein
LFTLEAWLHVIVVGIAVTALAVALQSADQKVPVLSPEPVKVVPAVGAQGYPVEAFCRDDATAVRLSIPPPDSTFRATYDMDRRVGGVHETVTVSVYADGSAVGTHYDSGNVPHDANVTPGALRCIEGKAK